MASRGRRPLLADAQYRASKLKYFLYRRALAQVFDYVNAYGKEHSRTILCYVATHSLINYATWRIVSPESSLIGVGAQGYIAQVWTGTARTPNVYNGERKERTFETAFLEYGSMQNLVRAVRPAHLVSQRSRRGQSQQHLGRLPPSNWQSTLTASLLMPEVSSYEIMPWPQRIFNGIVSCKELSRSSCQQGSNMVPTGAGLRRSPARRSYRCRAWRFPKHYETELQW